MPHCDPFALAEAVDHRVPANLLDASSVNPSLLDAPCGDFDPSTFHVCAPSALRPADGSGESTPTSMASSADVIAPAALRRL